MGSSQGPRVDRKVPSSGSLGILTMPMLPHSASFLRRCPDYDGTIQG